MSASIAYATPASAHLLAKAMTPKQMLLLLPLAGRIPSPELGLNVMVALAGTSLTGETLSALFVETGGLRKTSRGGMALGLGLIVLVAVSAVGTIPMATSLSVTCAHWDLRLATSLSPLLRRLLLLLLWEAPLHLCFLSQAL